MLSGKILLCFVLVAAWRESASLPVLPARIGEDSEIGTVPEVRIPVEMMREGVPPPLCAARCVAPSAGPVCAFDATGTARTFSTLCELEAASCRESTYYAITSLGVC
ncbi:uncharacterized protein LOC113509812 [Galleria mellonella]|uniref:Uncharacterized protein LOC113509812 n=1 Tax=Galleria mellonella TaxID=7137 RepID=A0A6J1W872_GALME|nr:uncharacterized protein LOC113509812 [Galleria mellonella]